MKTKDEIEKHVRDLERALTQPCDCASMGHSKECEGGARMILANIDALRWVLGVNLGYDRVVARMQMVPTTRETVNEAAKRGFRS